MSGVSANAVLESLETAAGTFVALDLRFVVVALAFQLGNLALRSFALRNVLAAAYPERRISAWTVGGAYAAGVALNAFAPARGGDALKIALLRLRVPGSSVPTLVSAGVLLTVLDALIGSSLIAGAWGFDLLPSLPSPQFPSLAACHEPSAHSGRGRARTRRCARPRCGPALPACTRPLAPRRAGWCHPANARPVFPKRGHTSARRLGLSHRGCLLPARRLWPAGHRAARCARGRCWGSLDSRSRRPAAPAPSKCCSSTRSSRPRQPRRRSRSRSGCRSGSRRSTRSSASRR